MSATRAFSGIQPTSDSFHLGNYLGALRQWVKLQDSHDALYSVVDLHAITLPQDPARLRQRTKVAAAQLFAIGLDPDRCTVFVQSHVQEHAELAWVLGCLASFGELSRMTQFKDKAVHGGAGQASLGLFSYPVLQAADILLYQTEQVPVGEDQRQHLELSRDIAARFNNRFGPTFAVPSAYILSTVGRIADLQNPSVKMSKSTSSPRGIIDILDSAEAIRLKISRAITDNDTDISADEAGRPGITNLLKIFAALSDDSAEKIAARYSDSGYGIFKRDLAEVVVGSLTPIRERASRLLKDERELDRMLAHGAVRARSVALRTKADVMDRVGFLPRAT